MERRENAKKMPRHASFNIEHMLYMKTAQKNSLPGPQRRPKMIRAKIKRKRTRWKRNVNKKNNDLEKNLHKAENDMNKNLNESENDFTQTRMKTKTAWTPT